MIYEGSRYVGQKVYQREVGETTRPTLTIRTINRALSEDMIEHVIKEGDRLFNLAYDYFKDWTSNPEDLWWLIADKNPHVDPLKLDNHVGESLWIPGEEEVRRVKAGIL